ncbi:DUF2933 domain-containing protein [Sinorhizobium medicae]|uniref:DUF2933 domain-containing protein n=1 Tax=Sinorhizobium medicae TaxID=110321 RepID=UPI001F3271C9|nr:DUF2933 domain-containing protein [Sinorhizobium medicae]
MGFLLIVGSLLLSDHRLHVLGYLPYLVVLACPLLHTSRTRTAWSAHTCLRAGRANA